MKSDTAAGPERLILPKRRELSLEQLSTAQIRLLASSLKADTAAESRPELLDLITTEAQKNAGWSWSLKVGKVPLYSSSRSALLNVCVADPTQLI